MIGLVYIVFFIFYITASILVVRGSYKYTVTRYGKGWIGGWTAALVMYGLVFWDWAPVYLAHKYYCATEAGFWVYKTPEQWAAENPQAIGSGWRGGYKKRFESFSEGHWRDWYSNFIYKETLKQPKYAAGMLIRVEMRLVDARNGDVLSKVVQFKKINESGMSLGTADVKDYKPWLALGGNYCTDVSGHDYRALDLENDKKLIQIGEGEAYGH